MSPFERVDDDGVCVITYRRPPRNLMSMAAMSQLEDLLSDLAADPTVAVVVITGGLPDYFVAHADLEDLAALGEGRPVEGDPGAWARAFALIEAMPQPVVAAVNGQAWGGGCELALACTMRFAARSAHFAQPEVAVGIIPGAGGTQRLPRLIGPGRAAEMILTGRRVDATEASQIGLVNEVFDDNGFLDMVLTRVRPMAQLPRGAILGAKRALIDGRDLPLEAGLSLETELFIDRQTDPDTLALQRAVVQRYRDAAPEEHITLDDVVRTTTP
ncbi:MAG: enoyl-CoA hydratase/isomerase family protein [Acidimicrobiia bacterium]|nr:enoyl-CoA hydratase/isomerase family protein [Acidimicrobiia bacterium]